MRTLNVMLTHLAATSVEAQLRQLRRIAPESRFAVAYAGPWTEFDLIGDPCKAWVSDPTLSGAPRSFQSYHVTLQVILEHWLRHEPALDSVYVFEFDHLILQPHFDRSLRELARDTGAGLMGKAAGPRNGSNWHHYTRFRRDRPLLEHLARVSARSDPGTMCGMLGTGMWLTRAAVEAYVGVGAHPRCYGELYVPTLVHHLGFEVVDVDQHSRLYEAVRWEPGYDARELIAMLDAGCVFVHPVKDAALRHQALVRAGDRAQQPHNRSEARVRG